MHRLDFLVLLDQTAKKNKRITVVMRLTSVLSVEAAMLSSPKCC